MINDTFKAFLDAQEAFARVLNRSSKLVQVVPLSPRPVQHYMARFACRGLVRLPGRGIQEVRGFGVHVFFPAEYQRTRLAAAQALAWAGPREIWHPNIDGDRGLICINPIARGTPLRELLRSCFNLISYQVVNMNEFQALNPGACQWARKNKHRFPLDSRSMWWPGKDGEEGAPNE